MPIKFVSLNEKFITIAKNNGYEAEVMKIQDYHPYRKTYYISPANSLGFMDGGIDYALSRIVMPGIEQYVKRHIATLNITNIIQRKYLPIGSSFILNYDNIKLLVVAPTMLLPQDVSKTNNAYYATMAVLYNILENVKENLNEVDIILTSMCCGYGKMSEEDSFKQIAKAIEDYKSYTPDIVNDNGRHTVIKQPNLMEQSKYYMNSEWINIKPEEIIR